MSDHAINGIWPGNLHGSPACRIDRRAPLCQALILSVSSELGSLAGRLIGGPMGDATGEEIAGPPSGWLYVDVPPEKTTRQSDRARRD